jgi:hypothetical protein
MPEQTRPRLDVNPRLLVTTPVATVVLALVYVVARSARYGDNAWSNPAISVGTGLLALLLGSCAHASLRALRSSSSLTNPLLRLLGAAAAFLLVLLGVLAAGMLEQSLVPGFVILLRDPLGVILFSHNHVPQVGVAWLVAAAAFALAGAPVLEELYRWSAKVLPSRVRTFQGFIARLRERSNVVDSTNASPEEVDVFISYAREDRASIDALAAAFDAKRHRVWYDKRIVAGANFTAVINERLETARCVVVVWSRAALASSWVVSEALKGLNRGVLVPSALEADVLSDLPVPFYGKHCPILPSETPAVIAAVSDLLARAPKSKDGSSH